MQPAEWPFSDLVLGAWLATGILFCLYNFFVGLVLRQRWLVAIIIPGAAFMTMEYAYFGRLTTPLPFGLEKNMLLAYVGCLIVPPAIMATAAFTRHFLSLRQTLPAIDRLLRRLGLFALLPLIGLPFLPITWVSTAMFAVVCIGAVAASYAHWHIWRSGGLDMRLLGGSWLLMGPALIAWFGRNLGVFEGNPVVIGIYLAGFGGNLIILSVATMARLRVLNEQVITSLKAAQRRNIAARKLESQLRDEILQRSRSFDAQKARANEEFENKRAFMSLISHDLRGPLANASQALDRVLDGEQSANDSGRLRLLEKVRETIHRQVSLVDRLLDLESLTQSSGKGSAYGVDFARVAEERLRNWQSSADEQRIELTTEIPDDTPLLGDALLISTLLDNLLANALRHTPAGERIVVRQCPAFGNCFEVSNSCPGLNVEQEQRIRNAVAGADAPGNHSLGAGLTNDARDPGSGRGIGLRLARSLITTQGGRLEYELRDHWVTLRVMLPEARPLILLVDDQAIQLSEMRQRIQSLNIPCEIAEALSVADALELINQRPPALVISDIRMPERDGFDLLSSIRRNGEWEEIRVALTSAAATEEESNQLSNKAMRAGADAYFNKPIPQDELRKLIRKLNPLPNQE